MNAAEEEWNDGDGWASWRSSSSREHGPDCFGSPTELEEAMAATARGEQQLELDEDENNAGSFESDFWAEGDGSPAMGTKPAKEKYK